MTDTLANKVLNHLVGTTFDPGALHLGLMTDSTTEVPASGAYARVDLSGKVTVTTDTLTLNTDIAFPQATADWGLITHIGIFSAATNGDMYFVGATSSVRSVSTGDTYNILADNLTLQLT